MLIIGSSLALQLLANMSSYYLVMIGNVLDNDKFGPGNRPYWEMKEGRAQFRYPDLIKALRSESDPGRRRQILAGYKTRIFGSSRGTVRAQGASQ